MKRGILSILYRLILPRLPRLETRIDFISRLPTDGRLLDLGCGEGRVLARFREVRPDLTICGVDREDFAPAMPPGIDFRRIDLSRESLPWPDAHFDGVSLIQLLEHLEDPEPVIREAMRVLRPEGFFYLETPDRKSLHFPSLSSWLPDPGAGPLNFYDDPTHRQVLGRRDILELLRPFHPARLCFGPYRNWLYALLSPFLISGGLLFRRRRWVVVGAHNLTGWSLYCRGQPGPVSAGAVANPRRERAARWVSGLLGLFWKKPGGKSRTGPLTGPEPGRILVIRLDHIGDVLISTPVYSALKKHYPEAKITVLTGPWASELLAGNPHVDRVISLACPWWSGKRGREAGWGKFLFEYARLLPRLRRHRFDLGIDLRGDLRHILLFLVAGGVRQRVGYDRSGGECLLSVAVESPGFFSLSELGKNRRLLREGLGVEMPDGRPRLRREKGVQARARNTLERNGISPQDLTVILSPSARSLLRTWVPERWAGLAAWLTQDYKARIVLLGGKDSRDMLAEIQARMSTPVLNLAGKTTLLEAAALCAEASIFIGVEGGLMHLAATTPVPIVALYGPMRPSLTGPERESFYPVGPDFPCSPCLQLNCPFSRTPRGDCLESLSLEEVKRTIRKVLD